MAKTTTAKPASKKPTAPIKAEPTTVESTQPVAETKAPVAETITPKDQPNVPVVETTVAKIETPTGPGRPMGSVTATPQVEVKASRCTKCNSTKRKPYSHTRAVHSPGTSDGLPHTHVVFRYTKCAKCGQARVDRTLENRTDAK
jgi:hypothetical protein